MTDDDLNQVMATNSTEMLSSMKTLMQRHGTGKVMLAMALTNCPKILGMLAKLNVSEDVRRVVAAQLNMAMTGWREAAGFDQAEIVQIADGLRSQMAVFEQDLNEATTKE